MWRTEVNKTGKLFLGFDCAISISSKKRIADKQEEMKIPRLNFKSIVGVDLYLEPFIRGWINYYVIVQYSALVSKINSL